MSIRVPKGLLLLTSSTEDMEEREDEEGDCLGVSEGEPWVVEGDESLVDAAALRRTVRLGRAVEAMAEEGD